MNPLDAEKRPEKKKSGKKRGGQAGHKGHSRLLYELSECESVLNHHPETCRCCGEILLGEDANPYRHQIVEIPPIKPIIVEQGKLNGFGLVKSCPVVVNFQGKPVNAHFIKTVPGRKSDVLDCQWIQQLHTYGLLSGSFRPDDQVCVLRSYIRQRDNLIRSSSTHIQRMQKALSEMNLHLHQVLSDITGVTGLKIIQAIIAGERDPSVLATYRDRRVKSTQADIEAALTGDYRPEHVFILSQELYLYQTYLAQIEKCDLAIQKCFENFEDKNQDQPPLKITRKSQNKRRNAPNFDLRSHLYRISGVDFTSIDGL
jgi:mRNA-degrading endonuclease RelE of RelBE toxin-antitoxin system